MIRTVGSCRLDQSLVLRAAPEQVDTPAQALVGPRAQAGEADAPGVELNLGLSRWLVGGRLSYADFRVATSLPFAGAASLPLDDFANVHKWHDRLLELDAWREPFAGLD